MMRFFRIKCAAVFLPHKKVCLEFWVGQVCSRRETRKHPHTHAFIIFVKIRLIHLRSQTLLLQSSHIIHLNSLLLRNPDHLLLRLLNKRRSITLRFLLFLIPRRRQLHQILLRGGNFFSTFLVIVVISAL